MEEKIIRDTILEIAGCTQRYNQGLLTLGEFDAGIRYLLEKVYEQGKANAQK